VRVEEDAPPDEVTGAWWWIPFEAMAGVAWIVLSLVTGGLFFFAVFIAWLFHSPRAGMFMRQMGLGLLGLTGAGLVALIITAATSGG
jgi:hypothetical protein